MIATRRPASRLLQRLSRPRQRRPLSSKGVQEEVGGSQSISSGHQESAGGFKPTSHSHHPEPVNESLGRGFYLTLTLLPLSIALYKFTQSTSDTSAPWLTRFINSYDSWREDWTRRNTLHTAMIEQAAHDRHLFHGSPGSRAIELRFPEVFNPGSPFNVPAGSQANLDELMAHYKRQNHEMEAKRERKAQAIYEGRESEEGRFVDGKKVVPGSATY